MSILLTSMLNSWVIPFIGFLAVADTYAMIQPNTFGHHFYGFILPSTIQIPPTTPKIFYEIDGLRLRAFDFMLRNVSWNRCLCLHRSISDNFSHFVWICCLCFCPTFLFFKNSNHSPHLRASDSDCPHGEIYQQLPFRV